MNDEKPPEDKPLEEVVEERPLFDTVDLKDFEDLLSRDFVVPRMPTPILKAEAYFPGAASGNLHSSLANAAQDLIDGKDVILYIDDINDVELYDIRLMQHVRGIIFNKVTRLNHAFIDLRYAGIPMIKVPESAKKEGEMFYKFGNVHVPEKGNLSFDGSTGEIYDMYLSTVESPIERKRDGITITEEEERAESAFRDVLDSCDQYLDGKLEVMINADDTETIQNARGFGTDSVSLVRSENILKQGNNRDIYGAYLLAILSENEEMIAELGARFKREQYSIFHDILRFQEGRRTQIRLLDPPITEFFDAEAVDRIHAQYSSMGITQKAVDEFTARLRNVEELNRERGVGIMSRYPGVYRSQLEAMMDAVKQLDDDDIETDLKIFIPYVKGVEDVKQVQDLAKKVAAQYPTAPKYDLGVTLEVPTGFMNGGEFIGMGITNFSIGTNDLYTIMGDSNRSSYEETQDGLKTTDDKIPKFIFEQVKEMAAAVIKHKASSDEYCIGIAGEMNEVKLKSLREVLPYLNYVAAATSQQIPELKLIISQMHLYD